MGSASIKKISRCADIPCVIPITDLTDSPGGLFEGLPPPSRTSFLHGDRGISMLWTAIMIFFITGAAALAIAREAARYGATIDPWDGETSPEDVIAVSDASLQTSAISPSDVTDCVELVADTGSPGCDSHVNSTGTRSLSSSPIWTTRSSSSFSQSM